jgi:hypothetical protein
MPRVPQPAAGPAPASGTKSPTVSLPAARGALRSVGKSGSSPRLMGGASPSALPRSGSRPSMSASPPAASER